MGGKNHQPCRNYLLNSTLLSKHLSLAYAHLELGNVSLEDIIISELISELDADHAPQGDDHYPVLMRELDISIRELQNSQAALLQLRAQMKAENFADLPTLGKINLGAIGTHLIHQGTIDLVAWGQAESIMEKGGFYAMVARFEVDLAELINLSQALHTKFQALKQNAYRGTLSTITEENQAGNFKIEFAALYTKWNQFNGLFLASSLISTELWYAFTDNGSLVSPESRFHVA